jgi:hypothetical protein
MVQCDLLEIHSRVVFSYKTAMPGCENVFRSVDGAVVFHPAFAANPFSRRDIAVWR